MLKNVKTTKTKTRITSFVFGRVYDCKVHPVAAAIITALVHTFGGTVFTRKE